MEIAAPPLPPDTWEALPSEVQMAILDLQAQAAAFRTENAMLQARIRGLEGRLGQDLLRMALRRRLVPLQARIGRLVWRGEAGPDRKAAALWTFARVEGVEPTNNIAERALRPAVLWRKESFGADSAAGCRFAERLLTVAATCRQQGRRLLDILVAAGEAVLQGTPAPSLLPAR